VLYLDGIKLIMEDVEVRDDLIIGQKQEKNIEMHML
jgi:hypothetical protein